MARTYGAYDLKPRKKRKDAGSRRKLYNGKPTKKKRKFNGQLIPYKSKRGNNDPVSIWYQEVKPMSREGYNKWNPKIRGHIDKTIKPFVGRPVKVNPEDISNSDKIADMSMRILQYPGTFNFMMPSASKSSKRVSYKKKAVVKIMETEDGLHARVSNYGKMRHYWFFI